VNVEYVDLVDYLAIAVEVTGLSVGTITQVARVDLADSALQAPAAGFCEAEFYPEIVDKAAVLVVRLTKNHPLPDGNKRAAWVALRLFVEIKQEVAGSSPAPPTDKEPANRRVLPLIRRYRTGRDGPELVAGSVACSPFAWRKWT
jgi:death-on-curing protein